MQVNDPRVALRQLKDCNFMDYFHPTVLTLSSFSHEFRRKLFFGVFLDTFLHHCKLPSAQLSAGAEAVPQVEGLAADGRADLRQQPAPAGLLLLLRAGTAAAPSLRRRDRKSVV